MGFLFNIYITSSIQKIPKSLLFFTTHPPTLKKKENITYTSCFRIKKTKKNIRKPPTDGLDKPASKRSTSSCKVGPFGPVGAKPRSWRWRTHRSPRKKTGKTWCLPCFCLENIFGNAEIWHFCWTKKIIKLHLPNHQVSRIDFWTWRKNMG